MLKIWPSHLSLLLWSWDSTEKVLQLLIASTFGTWASQDMPEMCCKQFTWKTAKGLMCCCTAAHVLSRVQQNWHDSALTVHSDRQGESPRRTDNGLSELLEGTMCSSYSEYDLSIYTVKVRYQKLSIFSWKRCKNGKVKDNVVTGKNAARVREVRHYFQLIPCSMPTESAAWAAALLLTTSTKIQNMQQHISINSKYRHAWSLNYACSLSNCTVIAP